MNIYKKLDKARELVRNTPHKKEGTGGVFKYFTPEQVELIVAEACTEVNLLPVCSLHRNEYGLYQEMVLVDLDNVDVAIKVTLATNKGDLRNTNDTQNMGSTDTYSERYLKMKVFQIKDNNLDPDSNQNEKDTEEIDDILG